MNDRDLAADDHDGRSPLGSTASTGDDSVDAALATLAPLGDLPVREHVAVFDAVHRALSDRLAE